jgi:hypothetical protein
MTTTHSEQNKHVTVEWKESAKSELSRHGTPWVELPKVGDVKTTYEITLEAMTAKPLTLHPSIQTAQALDIAAAARRERSHPTGVYKPDEWVDPNPTPAPETVRDRIVYVPPKKKG